MTERDVTDRLAEALWLSVEPRYCEWVNELRAVQLSYLIRADNVRECFPAVGLKIEVSHD